MKYTKEFEKWLSRTNWPRAMFRHGQQEEIKKFAFLAWKASQRRSRNSND